MESYVWWNSLNLPGLQQLHLVEDETGVVADGLVLGSTKTTIFRLYYRVWLDAGWNTRECLLQLDEEQDQNIHLYSDGQGHWTDTTGAALSILNGCLDIDISVTPFTNTLPIRRLTVAPGESTDILVAYINILDLSIRPLRQRYTCLSRSASGGVYRYENLESHFTTDLSVDAQGLIINYPEFWERVKAATFQ